MKTRNRELAGIRASSDSRRPAGDRSLEEGGCGNAGGTMFLPPGLLTIPPNAGGAEDYGLPVCGQRLIPGFGPLWASQLSILGLGPKSGGPRRDSDSPFYSTPTPVALGKT